MQTFDLEAEGLRALNTALQAQTQDTNQTSWQVLNPKGAHAVAVGPVSYTHLRAHET